MTPQRVADLIAAYGAATEKWPQAERAAALAILERTPALRAELAQMAALDAALDRWPCPAPQLDAAAVAAHVSAAPRPRVVARRPFLRIPQFGWPNAAGLAAAALAGFLVGWSGLDVNGSGDAPQDNVDRQIVASLVEDATW